MSVRPLIRFSLKHALISLTLIAIGMAALTICVQLELFPGYFDSFILWHAAGALIGAGIGVLLHKPVRGLLAGLALQFAIFALLTSL